MDRCSVQRNGINCRLVGTETGIRHHEALFGLADWSALLNNWSPFGCTLVSAIPHRCFSSFSIEASHGGQEWTMWCVFSSSLLSCRNFFSAGVSSDTEQMSCPSVFVEKCCVPWKFSPKVKPETHSASDNTDCVVLYTKCSLPNFTDASVSHTHLGTKILSSQISAASLSHWDSSQWKLINGTEKRLIVGILFIKSALALQQMRFWFHKKESFFERHWWPARKLFSFLIRIVVGETEQLVGWLRKCVVSMQKS